MRSEKNVLVIGSGVIGLCSAFYLTRRGHRVTVIDRATPDYEGCSFGNAGLVCPSHFVPLAAPGMVARGLKWMGNPESPFWIKPRWDRELFDWGWKFFCAANKRHVARAAPLLRDLNVASRTAFEELADSSHNDFGLVKKGLLLLFNTERAFEEESKTVEDARRLGIPAEVLDPKAAAQLDPGVRMDIAGAIHFPTDCHLSPNRFMLSMRSRLQQSGVQFRWNTEITGFDIKSSSHIEAVHTNALAQTSESAVSQVSNLRPSAESRTPSEFRLQPVSGPTKSSTDEIRADEYILCTGSWSPSLARQLSLNLPMQAGKGYSLTLPNPRQLPQICAIFNEARVAVTPIGQALRFGGTMEIAGLNENINPARIRGIIKSVPKYYPDFTPDDFAGVKPWCGLRPCSPDGLPYLGRTARYSNLTIATGHAMMGLSLGPVTGQLVAQIISDLKPFLDITQLHPDRYSR